MGDAALRVQTKYPDADALWLAVGATLSRGSLRVPLQVAFEQPFELVLASLDGEEVMKGTAEVVEHAGDATWIRFQSAAADDTRYVLVDSEVMSPASVANKRGGRDARTAANEPLLPPPPPAFDVSDTPSSIAEAAAAACDHEREDQTNVDAAPDVEAAARAALEGHFDAIEPSPKRETAAFDPAVLGEPPPMPITVETSDAEHDLRIPHTGEGIPLRIDTVQAPPIIDDRPTVESPAIVATLAQITAPVDGPAMPAHDDTIAKERGVRPISAPYVRNPAHRSGRKIVIASVSVAVVAVGVAIGSVMYAQDAVARGGRTQHVAIEAKPVEAPPPVVEVPAPAVQPATCSLDIAPSVPGSTIYIDGAVPTSNVVECGKPLDVEVRHARYETFKRTVTPTGHDELRATLEREKTALTVWSEPQGAQVAYNGTPIGKTPLTVRVARYERGQLDFSMPGMQRDWRRIVPKTAEKTVSIQLRKQ